MLARRATNTQNWGSAQHEVEEEAKEGDHIALRYVCSGTGQTRVVWVVWRQRSASKYRRQLFR